MAKFNFTYNKASKKFNMIIEDCSHEDFEKFRVALFNVDRMEYKKNFQSAFALNALVPKLAKTDFGKDDDKASA